MKKLIWSSILISTLMVGNISQAADSSTATKESESISQVTTNSTETTTESTSEAIPDGLAITKSDISLLISDMVNEGKLSQFQYEDFQARIEKATTIEEVTLVYSDALDLAKLNKDLYQSSFDEKVYNTKYQLGLLVKAGKLTQKQADQFIEKIDKSTTIEELDNLWAEIEATVNKSTDTTSSTNSSSSSVKQTQEVKITPKSDTKNSSSNLPKTGEKQSNVGLQLIAVVSLLMTVILIKRKS